MEGPQLISGWPFRPSTVAACLPGKRAARSGASGLTIAERLKAHGKVERVNHPVYSNHPGKATLAGYAGLFSFEVTDDVDIPAFVDALTYFRIGVSWGGHESLVVPAKASLEQTPGVNSMARFGVSPRTIRVNIGLEDVEDLWNDIAQAFEKSKK